MCVRDLFLPVLALDERLDELHGARAVERHHGNDVFDLRGLQVFDVPFHAVGFQLENAGCLRAAQEVEGEFVIERDRVNVDLVAVNGLDDFDAVADDREV